MNHNWLLMLLYETYYIFYLEYNKLLFIMKHNLLKMHIKILYILGCIKIYVIYMCHTGRCKIKRYS
jgi:hypothetical protein